MDDENEKIINAVDGIINRRRDALNHFLSYLFWHDYHAHYIDTSTTWEITDTIQEWNKDREYSDCTLIEYDEGKYLELANKIRVAIGLPKLEMTKTNALVEVKR